MSAVTAIFKPPELIPHFRKTTKQIKCLPSLTVFTCLLTCFFTNLYLKVSRRKYFPDSCSSSVSVCLSAKSHGMAGLHERRNPNCNAVCCSRIDHRSANCRIYLGSGIGEAAGQLRKMAASLAFHLLHRHRHLFRIASYHHSRAPSDRWNWSTSDILVQRSRRSFVH